MLCFPFSGSQLQSLENPLWEAIKDRKGNKEFKDINFWPWGIHFQVFFFERHRRKPMVREATPTMGFRLCFKGSCNNLLIACTTILQLSYILNATDTRTHLLQFVLLQIALAVGNLIY